MEKEEKKKEGIDIMQILNWIVTIIFGICLVYVVSRGWIGKTCYCPSTNVCDLTKLVNISILP